MKKDTPKKLGLIEIMVGTMVLAGIFGTIWVIVDSMTQNGSGGNVTPTQMPLSPTPAE